ncbi:MAG: N-acetylmuramoyl-L-alanine amidase [Cetobacterium sp.]
MRKTTKYLIVHCSATSPSMTHVDAKEIDRWHRQKGWLKLGYHFVIRRDGFQQIGRQINEVGAHAFGHNQHSIGICLVGGVKEDKKTPEDNFTAAQKETLYRLLLQLRAAYPKAEIITHQSVEKGKTCPNFDLKGYLAIRPELDPIIETEAKRE